ncbi:Mus7/MMS22 family-domain-containing protein [Umbelopsis sp. PMI_123]|nr:Mus7/MMS22 family-domain-containing protein [Umbelopsis sp. PMI_123]
MATSPGELSNINSEDQFVLSATSSQEYLDEKSLQALAGHLAADPNALELQCITEQDGYSSSNASTLPLLSFEAGLVPETPPARSPEWQSKSPTPNYIDKEALIPSSIFLDAAYLQSDHISTISPPKSTDDKVENRSEEVNLPLNSPGTTGNRQQLDSGSLDQMNIIQPTIDSPQSHIEQLPLRMDFFDRMHQPLPPSSPPNIQRNNSNSLSLDIGQIYGARSLRKRRDIQLHPFTIEKLQYKAQVGHIHDSHLPQSEIQKRRVIREKYVQPDKELLERAAAAQKSNPTASRKQRARHDPQNQHAQHRQIHKRPPPPVPTSTINNWHSRTPRAMVTYGKKNFTISTNADRSKANPPSTQEPETLPSQSNIPRTMQQQLDLLFPEFSIDNIDDQTKDTREKKKRRRVIQDESDTDDGSDSVQYLGEAETILSSGTEEELSDGPTERQSKSHSRLDVLKERRALKGILPMSFTKVFSKELTEDEKLLQAQRRENRQRRRRNRTGSANLAKEVSTLSIATDLDQHHGHPEDFTAEALNVNDIFTDEEEQDDVNQDDNDSVWDLDDWLGQTNDDEPIKDSNERRVYKTPAVLRDKDPIDRMIIRNTAPRRSGKTKSSPKSSTSASTSRTRVMKYSYRSPIVKHTDQSRRSARRRTISRHSRQSSANLGHRQAKKQQQRIWRFMDVKKARSSPSSTPQLSQPESVLEAEDQHFKQKSGSKEVLPAWVQALLQTRDKLKPVSHDNPHTIRPIIPAGVGPFYQSIADVTKVNWWQRHGRRPLLTDTLENTEPTDVQLEQQYWDTVDQRDISLPDSMDGDIQIINPRKRPRKTMSSKKRKVSTKQSNLFTHHGFSKASTEATANVPSTALIKINHKVEKASPRVDTSSSHGPSENQIAFIRFLNDTQVFPTTFSPKELGVEWNLPRNSFIMRGFLKNFDHMMQDAPTDYDRLVTDNGVFSVFGRSFNINSDRVQDLLDIILHFFWQAMKSFQDICVESNIQDRDVFTTNFCEFLAFVTIWLRHWVPLLPSQDRQTCEDFVIKQSAVFQKRMLHVTKLQTILDSSDPTVSLSVSVTQILLLWFVFSSHWEQQLRHNSLLLQCNSHLEIMQALLLWLGPEPLSTGDALGQLTLEAWIYYLSSLVTTDSLCNFSTLISNIKKSCVADGLDRWRTSEVIWQWLFVLKEIEQYSKREDQTKENSQLWFAVHDLLKDIPVLNNADGDLSYSEILLQVTDTRFNELVDDYIRVLFRRVHQLCRLYPSPASRNAILQLHSFYLNRRFQDLTSEQDSSFPEFFIDFIGYIPHDLSPDDSCFHIFLKTLCITLQTEQDAAQDMEKERKQLRRFLSQLVPTHVMTIHNGDHGSYTALGNHFNLSMLFAHVVSSDIMRRSIVQAKSFLNFHESDYTARKMYFEAFTLLARIYAFHDDSDGLSSIVRLLNERLSYLVEEYARMQARQSMAKQGFLPVEEWLADQNDRRDLIESAFIYIWKIVRDAVAVADAAAGWFELTSLSLDKGWSSVLDITTSYPDGTRLYAVNFVRSILAVRQQRVARLKYQTTNNTAEEARLSSSLKSTDSQDFDMFDDFDYEAIDMHIEKVYFDHSDRTLAHTVKSWVIVALQSLLPHTTFDSELQQATQLALNECQQLLNDHRM